MSKSTSNPAPRPKSNPTGSYISGFWDGHRITAAFLLALLPPVAVIFMAQGASLGERLGLAVGLALGWQLLFARLRHRTFAWEGIVTALTFVVLVPPTTPLWQQAFAVTFGVVLGEQIFGGRGRNFLNPTTLALAFLFFSFQDPTPQPATGWGLAAAVVPGVILLLLTRLISWRVLIGITMGCLGAAAWAGPALDWGQFFTGTLAFGVVFLACDPVTSASTNLGRWIYGVLTGALVIILGQAGAGPGTVHAIVFATLLGSVFAPLIDYGVVGINVRRRRRRYG